MSAGSVFRVPEESNNSPEIWNKIKQATRRGETIPPDVISDGKLMEAAVWDDQPEVIKYLVDQGANVNQVDSHKYSLLHIAICYERIDAARALVKAGASLQLVNSVDLTPLHEAVNRYPKQSTKITIEFIDFLVSHGAPVCFCNMAHYRLLKKVLIMKDRTELGEYFVSHGWNLNTPIEGEDTTFLGYAVHFLEKDQDKNEDRLFAIWLVKHGANVNCKTTFGTPLHYAAREDDVSLARLLVEHGADVNAKNDEGKTPLHFAKRNGCTAVAKYLTEQGGKDCVIM